MTVTQSLVPVQYVVDESGQRKAVQITLSLWEQIASLLANQYMPAADAARRIQVDIDQLERWLANGTLPGIEIDGQWFISVEVMNRFAPFEQILDDLDAEKIPPTLDEILAMFSQDRKQQQRTKDE